MKPLVFLFLLFISYHIEAQLAEEAKIVIVSCKSGDLYIDGVKVATLEADDAHQEKIAYGEHYLQLKAGTEKVSLTIKVTSAAKEVIKIGCAETVQPATKTIKIIEKELYLSGMLMTPSVDQNLVAFNTGDEIVLNCDVVNKKGTANVSIKEIESGREIYKRESFETIIDERILVPVKGVYFINFNTNALLGKNVKFSIARTPSPNSNPAFKTSVIKRFDTSFVEVLNTTTRVYSTTNMSNPNRTSLKINLPANTTYWAYWVGVDQEASQSMKTFSQQLPKVATLLSTNPVVLFGMKLIPALPMVNATSTVSYKFMDSRNAQAFVYGQPYSYFKFKHASNISTDYALISEIGPDIVLGFENSSSLIGKDVDIKVVAFIVKPKFIIEE